MIEKPFFCLFPVLHPKVAYVIARKSELSEMFFFILGFLRVVLKINTKDFSQAFHAVSAETSLGIFFPEVSSTCFQGFSLDSSRRFFRNLYKILSGVFLSGFLRDCFGLLSYSFSRDICEILAEVLPGISSRECFNISHIFPKKNSERLFFFIFVTT